MQLPTQLSYSPLQPPSRSPLPRTAASVLSSSSFSSRLSLLSTLGLSQRDDPAVLRSSHSVVLNVPGHTGCVNSVSWGGELGDALVSAGDDTK